MDAEAECQFRRSRPTRSLDPRKHDLNSIRFGNFSNVRRILTLHFIPGGGGAVEEKRTDEMGAKSVLSSSRQFTNSPPSHNPVQTKPIYIARAVLPPPEAATAALSFFLPFLPSPAAAAAGHTPSFISRTLS